MLGTLTLVLGFGIKWLATGFQRFGTSLAEFRAEVKEALKDTSVTMRDDLAELKIDVGKQVSHLEHKMERHEDRMREMSLLIERRVNRLEAKVDHYPFVPAEIVEL